MNLVLGSFNECMSSSVSAENAEACEINCHSSKLLYGFIDFPKPSSNSHEIVFQNALSVYVFYSQYFSYITHNIQVNN